jgi:hypothetical protein
MILVSPGVSRVWTKGGYVISRSNICDKDYSYMQQWYCGTDIDWQSWSWLNGCRTSVMDAWE